MTYLSFAKEVVYFAGGILRKHFYAGDFEERIKDKDGFVTSVDVEIENYLKRRINEAYPEHSIIAEESGGKRASHTWVIDPLDGTNNFSRHIPFFNISLALEKDGEVIVGVVYNPITDEMFYAEKGKGSFVNGKPLKAKSPQPLEKSFWGFCHSKAVVDKAMKIFSYFKKNALEIRKLGSAALEISYVAAGRLDGFIGYGLKLWDFRAAELIARESGLMAMPEKKDGVDFILVAHKENYSFIKEKISEILG